MTDSMREEFEKFIKTKYLYSDEIDFHLEPDGSDYRSDELKEWVWIWQAAWKVRGEHDVKLCDKESELYKVDHRDYPLGVLVGCENCAEAIRNQVNK